MKATTQTHSESEALGNLIIKRNFRQRPLGIAFIVLVMLLLILLVGFPRLGAAAE